MVDLSACGLRYAVYIYDPDGCPDVAPDVAFASLDEAKRYCREQSVAFSDLLLFSLFDSFDGVELHY